MTDTSPLSLKSLLLSLLWGQKSAQAASIAITTFALDQANKFLFLFIFKINSQSRIKITPFLDIVFTKNTGISYSLFDSSSYAWQLILASLAAIASLSLWIWICRVEQNPVLLWGLSLIVGGALGNAIDRLLHGGVADFYSLHAFGYYWYIFNLADVAIVAGVILLLYDSFVLSRIGAVKSN